MDTPKDGRFDITTESTESTESRFGSLRDAKLATLAECVNVALPGLAGYVKEEWFKLYLSDIGLLLATYGPLAKREMLAGTLAGTVKGASSRISSPASLSETAIRSAPTGTTTPRSSS